MRKQVFGRQFKRDFNERKALFKGLLSSLVLNGSIKTTEEKAKAIRGQAEKLVTKARKTGNNLGKLFSLYLTNDAIKKLISDVAPRFSKRNGGYTRIVRLGRRVSDGAKMALIEWVELENQNAKIPTSPRLRGASKDQKQEEAKTVSADSKKSKTVAVKKSVSKKKGLKKA